MMRSPIVVALVGIVVASSLTCDEAMAGGTYGFLEAGVGGNGPAYDGEDPGWSFGLAFGTTLRPRRSKVRFHILGNVQTQQTTVNDALGPWLSRTDIAAFVSQRTIFPVSYPLRLYLETGVGTRFGYRDAGKLGTEGVFEPLIVLALGAQMRWTREVSVGLRAAVEPLEPYESQLDFGLAPGIRTSMLLTLGFHF